MALDDNPDTCIIFSSFVWRKFLNLQLKQKLRHLGLSFMCFSPNSKEARRRRPPTRRTPLSTTKGSRRYSFELFLTVSGLFLPGIFLSDSNSSEKLSRCRARIIVTMASWNSFAVGCRVSCVFLLFGDFDKIFFSFLFFLRLNSLITTMRFAITRCREWRFKNGENLSVSRPWCSLICIFFRSLVRLASLIPWDFKH